MASPAQRSLPVRHLGLAAHCDQFTSKRAFNLDMSPGSALRLTGCATRNGASDIRGMPRG